MSDIYIGIEGSYKSFTMALFEDDDVLQVAGGGKSQASSSFLLSLQKVLQKNNKTLQDLRFVSVNQGPGAFTSLRVLIATLNGLAFNNSCLLVGVDGLDALAHETFELIRTKGVALRDQPLLIVSLLNAYNNEVYHGEYLAKGYEGTDSSGLVPGKLACTGSKGYKKIELYLQDLASRYPDHNFIFTGNGAELFRELLIKGFGKRVLEPFAPISTCSAEFVGKIGYARFCKRDEFSSVDISTCSELKPLYLKSQMFDVRK